MRHPEPPSVIHYRATLNADVPQVCHTCDHYTKQGICSQFNEAPPKEFASEPGECSFWVWEVPF